MKQAVAELPERQRLALVLSRIEGMTYREIAEIMGGTASSVDSLIVRAKETSGQAADAGMTPTAGSCLWFASNKEIEHETPTSQKETLRLR